MTTFNYHFSMTLKAAEDIIEHDTSKPQEPPIDPRTPEQIAWDEFERETLDTRASDRPM